jgi:CheY-like chemotaxis protein/anti-sigma regulatory factor (Ser/Thr protein kinase)
MTAILGYAELLLEELRSEGGSAARVEALRTIKRNGAYLLELIDDILDLSRVESGRVSIHRVAFSPAQVLADVRSLLAPRAREKGVVFTARRGPGVPERVVSDPLRLRQVLINVVGNAVKFTDSGSVSVTLECVEREGQPWLSFRVSDTGPGIAEDQLERVFEPLYQIDGSPTRRHPGVGLGLAIAKRLCRGLGGTIEVASRPGAGSTFWILIPATRPSGAVSAAEASEETEAEGSVPWLGGLRLLVAEDASDTRVLLEDLLRRRGALVEAAKNGEQAVRLAMDALDKGCPFDAILMDVQMPVLDGYAATRVLRALGCKVPILAVTAYAMAEDRERCMAAGFDDYVAKPIDGAALGRALWSRVGQARGSAPTVAPPGPPGTGESSSEEASRRASHGR